MFALKTAGLLEKVERGIDFKDLELTEPMSDEVDFLRKTERDLGME